MRIRIAGPVACIRAMINTYKTLVEKSKGKKSVRSPGRR
jgi:hypothetical protein